MQQSHPTYRIFTGFCTNIYLKTLNSTNYHLMCTTCSTCWNTESDTLGGSPIHLHWPENQSLNVIMTKKKSYIIHFGCGNFSLVRLKKEMCALYRDHWITAVLFPEMSLFQNNEYKTKQIPNYLKQIDDICSQI